MQGFVRQREDFLNPTHPFVAVVLKNLAGLYEMDKRYLEAESVRERLNTINADQ